MYLKTNLQSITIKPVLINRNNRNPLYEDWKMEIIVDERGVERKYGANNYLNIVELPKLLQQFGVNVDVVIGENKCFCCGKVSNDVSYKMYRITEFTELSFCEACIEKYENQK